MSSIKGEILDNGGCGKCPKLQGVHATTLMSLFFAGTKFGGFRDLGGHPRNLIPAK